MKPLRQEETGNLEAKKVFEETKSLLKLLGYNENRLDYQLLPAESGGICLEILNGFLDSIKNGRG